MSKWYDENHSRGVTYYVIWLIILWVLSFQFPYEDYEVISWILIVGGFFGFQVFRLPISWMRLSLGWYGHHPFCCNIYVAIGMASPDRCSWGCLLAICIAIAMDHVSRIALESLKALYCLAKCMHNVTMYTKE